MEQKIKATIENNYKDVCVGDIELDGDYLIIKAFASSSKLPFIAKRILDKYKNIRVVHFTGGWTESVYTRETLKWAGYKMKDVK